ncbi:MAG: polysaccharide export protein [Candidatus Azobacteroides sp.]|nr:polysaccharide export protein [Candidatus Azobacteroides sp.]
MFNPYSQPSNYQQTAGTIAPMPIIGFLVDVNGNVKLPMVGDVKVSGLTTEEATLVITELLEKYLISPTVNVRIANFKISVLGEVARPAVYTIPNEIITLPQALSLAGDLTIYGKRENILIIREENGKRTFARLDIRDRKIFDSEYYYLHPNDIVYVETKSSKATSTDLVYQLSSVVLTSLTFLLTVARFFKD